MYVIKFTWCEFRSFLIYKCISRRGVGEGLAGASSRGLQGKARRGRGGGAAGVAASQSRWLPELHSVTAAKIRFRNAAWTIQKLNQKFIQRTVWWWDNQAWRNCSVCIQAVQVAGSASLSLLSTTKLCLKSSDRQVDCLKLRIYPQTGGWENIHIFVLYFKQRWPPVTLVWRSALLLKNQLNKEEICKAWNVWIKFYPFKSSSIFCKG